MHAAPSPLVYAVTAGVLVVAALLAVTRLFEHRRAAAARTRLPHGADAALWSIVEAMPDPRNHLALTRDLSGEVHITDADRADALARAMDAVTARRITERQPAANPTSARRRLAARPAAAAPKSDAPVVELRSKSVASDEDYTEPEGAEDLTLTGRLFFAESPQLSRF